MENALHLKLIDFGIQLNILNENDAAGICSGLSAAWLDAVLSNTQLRLQKLIEEICILQEILNKHNDKSAKIIIDRKLNTIRNKIKNNENLTEYETKLLQIEALYNQIKFYQSPNELSCITQNIFWEKDIVPISKLVCSEEIEAKNGLFEAFTISGVYTQREVIEYLSNIEDIFHSIQFENSQAIGIRITNISHCMAIAYCTENKVWHVFDSNQQFSESNIAFEPVSIEQISEYIFDAFNRRRILKFVSLHTQIIITEDNSKKNELIEKLQVFKNTQFDKIETQIIQRIEKTDIISLVATSNDHETLDAILGFGKFATTDIKGNAAMIDAIVLGYHDVVQVLLKHNENPNQEENNSNTSPLMMAVTLNNIQIVKLLLNYGANPNLILENGATALMIAIKNHNIEIVQILLANRADVNLGNFKNMNPLLYAIYKNKPDVSQCIDIIKCLIEAGAILYSNGNSILTENVDLIILEFADIIEEQAKNRWLNISSQYIHLFHNINNIESKEQCEQFIEWAKELQHLNNQFNFATRFPEISTENLELMQNQDFYASLMNNYHYYEQIINIPNIRVDLAFLIDFYQTHKDKTSNIFTLYLNELSLTDSRQTTLQNTCCIPFKLGNFTSFFTRRENNQPCIELELENQKHINI